MEEPKNPYCLNKSKCEYYEHERDRAQRFQEWFSYERFAYQISNCIPSWLPVDLWYIKFTLLEYKTNSLSYILYTKVL
jgi:hypothetical protein